MKKKWLTAFSNMTYGIYVLTVKYSDSFNGMIASWVTQVSYEPPLIMVAVHPNRYSHSLIEKSDAFALHVLDKSQKDMLKRFKGPDPEKKFVDLSWETKKTGAPILKDCMAWFELQVKERYSPGNHTLFIGEVINSGVNSPGTPLCTLEYDGMYIGKQ
ncbi:MAG: flavin reductase [Desulfobacula sp.]|jgi:flavin reductase (DIM6/NTAB) family NADH-FMN oxidoreductase RutF|uniref:flavin reductase family protein n=1 Tax=Desulfobacula sp. TaxID=2593537 RepID=UPI001DBBB623|nr:flavin reductase [Desulfobacula sp.]MBT3486556.1 flavin reductase [Desulfobacula sp.]MBT3805296.1 flavin reductase [Desulfobacula sp.]MBT4025648.1 flavin reductase [Desulfobacula sp.]MBT4197539.1 flavin reductase [Desulfobacula sp.]